MIDQQDTMVLTVDSEDGLTYSCVLESDDDESDEASTTSKGTIDQSALCKGFPVQVSHFLQLLSVS